MKNNDYNLEYLKDIIIKIINNENFIEKLHLRNQTYCYKTQDIMNQRIQDESHKINEFIDRYDHKLDKLCESVYEIKQTLTKITFYFFSAGSIAGSITALIITIILKLDFFVSLLNKIYKALI